MIHVLLYEPEIPPNTGNIIRLCANTGTVLHLIHPLGFELQNARLQRAGLDYHEWANIQEHDSLQACLSSLEAVVVYAISTRGNALYSDIDFTRPANIALLFGPETRGLPQFVLDNLVQENILRIPMQSVSRSLNLSNAVAVVVYEALRQAGFEYPGPLA